MGQAAHCGAPGVQVASPALGDANRGRAHLALQPAVSNLGEARRTDPPERRAFSIPETDPGLNTEPTSRS